MNKQQLLEFIQGLPDNVQAAPFEYSEISTQQDEWVSQGRSTQCGGVYQCDVENKMTLRLEFKTKFEGEFLRTCTDPDGSFRNIRRLN
jgi:hypothetical protein